MGEYRTIRLCNKEKGASRSRRQAVFCWHYLNQARGLPELSETKLKRKRGKINKESNEADCARGHDPSQNYVVGSSFARTLAHTLTVAPCGRKIYFSSWEHPSPRVRDTSSVVPSAKRIRSSLPKEEAARMAACPVRSENRPVCPGISAFAFECFTRAVFTSSPVLSISSLKEQRIFSCLSPFSRAYFAYLACLSILVL